MTVFSRREFLKRLGAAALIIAGSRQTFGNGEKDFEMLVVGDSLAFGQGLKEKDKFYALVKDWIQTTQNVNVNLKVKAHTAATIFLHEDDAEFLRKADGIDFKTHPPEVGLPFPTIKSQIDIAKSEYEETDKVNLVLLTGGLVDLTVAGILNPYGTNESLRRKIKKHCYTDLCSFLEYSAKIFPDALFVVAGYYPIISKKTDTGKMFNAFLEAYGFPRPVKFAINNFVGKQFFKRVRRKTIKRSAIWAIESNREFEAAIRRTNEFFGEQRAVFVKSPIGEANAFETAETFLFSVDKKGRTDDALFDERAAKCRKTLLNLKEKIGFEDSIRQCEISSMGHPNVRGANAYAQAIIEKLKLTWQKSAQ